MALFLLILFTSLLDYHTETPDWKVKVGQSVIVMSRGVIMFFDLLWGDVSAELDFMSVLSRTDLVSLSLALPSKCQVHIVTVNDRLVLVPMSLPCKCECHSQ